ncbi:MAG: ribosomal RNA small subunit methyltransferase RsmB [Candidatus Atelocyanobacterium thalassa isolate SIO64986]|uniref:16S rRNA (cytosine(967)-C(5))-methyltransferase n=1 Tax=Candidatus Atelocyanobacterium thalassa isolate SIO64986 TaxID=1527444 RepID=A0A086CFG0_9CHRO|nr:MAG: ribosomal RNA small subunit methyltransferase RsmB [Candidatus Atelocyanobacterium thalassa isolate SIO64986]
MKVSNVRELTLKVLREIDKNNSFINISLSHALKDIILNKNDSSLCTELVYGIIRCQRTLDNLIDQLGNKKSQKQSPVLRRILHIGLYQLLYLDHIPPSAAVNTSVDLAKNNNLNGLSKVVNAILRKYIRIREKRNYQLTLSGSSSNITGIKYSFPNWIVEHWHQRWGKSTTEKLCYWFNQSPTIDIRINSLKTTIEEVRRHLIMAKVNVEYLPYLPYALRLKGKTGDIKNLPGFMKGNWTVQDISAQLVSYLLDPKVGDIIIDACAAPGGKTTHIAELMQDKGLILACDRISSRLGKIQQNVERLGLKSIKLIKGDSRYLQQFTNFADRVLIDAPCSGLGTLHRNPDIRWRQTPEKIKQLSIMQKEILHRAAQWVKPNGVLVYSTCTLNIVENEIIVHNFLKDNPEWHIEKPLFSKPFSPFITPSGCLQIFPHQHYMDGFFMVKLRKNSTKIY